VSHGDFRMLLPNDENIYAFARRLGDVELMVLANFSSEDVSAELPEMEAWADAELVGSNYPDVAAAPAGKVALRAWEAVVYRRTREE
jgi:oligo-1,6-glucosidase